MLLRKTSPMNDSIDDPVPDSAKLIKLEAGSRSGVQFKPSKRMKKRRQLDALVGNDKKLPRRKHSAHELLRSNDSGSSEVEEFGILHGHKLDKSWTSSSCCFTCYSLMCALIVTSCLLACATLIWMHLQLKRDFNDLKDRLELVENRNAATPEEFQAVQSKLSQIDKSLSDIRTGKSGIQNLNKSIVIMQAKIASLEAAQQQQKQSIQTSNSNNHEDVAKAVADLGSGLHSTQEDVKTLKNSQNDLTTNLEGLSNRVTALENPSGREGVVSESNVEGLRVSLAQVNSTLSQAVNKAVADLNQQQTHIEALSQFTQGLQEQVGNVHQLAVGLNQSQHILLEALTSQDSSASDTADLTQLQNKVNELQQTLEKGLLLLHQMQAGESNLTEANSSMDLSSPPPSENVFPELLREHEEFTHFRTEVYQDLSSLNATVASMNGAIDSLRKDMGDLSTKVNIANGNITSIAAVVKDVISFIHTHDLTTGEGPDSSNVNRDSQAGKEDTEGGDSTTKNPSSSNVGGDEVHKTTSAPRRSKA